MANEKIILKITKSLKTIETNFENSIKLQEKNLSAIKSEIDLIHSLLSELEAEKKEIKSTPSSVKNKLPVSKKKPANLETPSELDHIQLYQTIMSERKKPDYSIEDNLLIRFIDSSNISVIQAFCDANDIILTVKYPKKKLYDLIISAITENKRF